ncbi:hypothetical protein [Ochrovirga pacifica]|uniref:hypothetical protein n=1 Tax=Ochrovirga pacifica TaxID=1042376 RepID=UPI000255A2A9|nr:hypothetical protein [Ochrovirga pacifica]
MKNNLVLFLFILMSSFSIAQNKLTWEQMAKVTFKEKYLETLDQLVLYPTFPTTLNQLNGKNVEITGYFLDIHPTKKTYILSKNPMASCFFCGGAGPETAMELQFSTVQKIETDAIVTITGKLFLNKDDIEHFNFILRQCKVTKTH